MQYHNLYSYSDKIFKLIYLQIDEILDKTFLDVEDFKLEYNISAKNFKYVEDKIFFHNLFVNVLNLIRNNSKETDLKPVLFLTNSYINKETRKIQIALRQLKILKKLLPIPLIIPLKTDVFSAKQPGLLREINHKCSNFYCKRKIRLSEVKKYLDTKGYTTLNSTLSGIVNLKGVYY